MDRLLNVSTTFSPDLSLLLIGQALPSIGHLGTLELMSWNSQPLAPLSTSDLPNQGQGSIFYTQYGYQASSGVEV